MDTVSDAGGTDTVQFGAGITSAQLVFAHVGNNLEVTIAGNGADKLVVSNYYVGTANKIETFRLNDGSTVPGGQVPAFAAPQRVTEALSSEPGFAASLRQQATTGPAAPTMLVDRFGALSQWSFLSRRVMLNPSTIEREPLGAVAQLPRVHDVSIGLNQQAQLLAAAMAAFGADHAAADSHDRQTIQPVHRNEPTLVSPALM